MKKLLAFASAMALSVMVLGAQAQKPGGKMAAPPAGSKMGGKMAAPPAGDTMGGAKKGVTGTSTGTVKSAPAGSTFVLTTAKSDVTVNISGAKVRNGSGQFVKAASIVAGAPAEATGTWKGRTLFATNVKLTALKSDKPAGGKMGGEKMGGKMTGGKMTGGKMSGGKLPK